MTNTQTETHINQTEIDAIKNYAAAISEAGKANETLAAIQHGDAHIRGRSDIAWTIGDMAELKANEVFDHAWTEDEGMVVLRTVLEMMGCAKPVEPVAPLRAGLKAIEHIELEDVAHLADALKARQKYLRANAARNAAATFQVGQDVELRGLKPQYVNGTTGIIRSIAADGKITVQLSADASHRVTSRFGRSLTVAASCVKDARS